MKALLVIIISQSSGYYLCEGTLIDKEKVPGTSTYLTTVTKVKCPDGTKYDYIVGIEQRQLRLKD